MIRVTKSNERGRITFTIDGDLSGDYIQVVEISCNQALSQGRPITVFLHDVLAIDEPGRALLMRLASKGVRLLATGVYTSYIVQDLLAACRRAPGSSHAKQREGRLRVKNRLIT
jgi:hypothetical protein